MQKLSGALIISGASLVLAVSGASAGRKTVKEPEKMVSRAEKFLGCTELQSSASTGNEGDFIEYKCISQFGPPMWMLIQEGVRYSFGFGKMENTPQMADGDAEGAIEWWGTSQKGKFVPRTVIKRYQFSDYGEPEKRTKQLAVFRLLKNGKSCVLAIISSSQTENSEARKIAQGGGKCLE
jgi:hypothetical protein